MKTLKFPPASIALLAAVLFGASTPAAKVLGGQISPQLLAGLLYLGSGIGLLTLNFFFRQNDDAQKEPSLKTHELPWLALVILFGGISAPLLLMRGLTTINSSDASLLLNLEGVFTALLAWFVFKENFDNRIFAGMVAIVLGSLVLVWKPDMMSHFEPGSLFIAAACFCWAMDNNLTRKISDADPVATAGIKGLAAGLVNTTLALTSGALLPPIANLLLTGFIGFLGYGVSLVLFIKSLRYLGTARTGAYFSIAPFSGTVLSLIFLHEQISGNLLLAGGLMAFGVWLHVTESHQHEHTHSEQEHEHLHVHDEHHQHEHIAEDASGEPHSHYHKHLVLTHSHPHFPDTHHRHEH